MDNCYSYDGSFCGVTESNARSTQASRFRFQPQEVLNYPGYYKPLSLRVCRILDNIGVSSDIRTFQTATAKTAEILFNLANSFLVEEPASLYIFGGLADGTEDIGVHPEFAVLSIREQWDVPGDKADFVLLKDNQPTICLVKFQQYGKQPELDKTDKYKTYKRKRNDYCSEIAFSLEELYGPATKLKYKSAWMIERVCRCRKWPPNLDEWKVRQRHCSWPSEELMRRLTSRHVFLDPQESAISFMYCRILMHTQENLLILSMNDTQYKCYIILKMVDLDIIRRMFKGEYFTPEQIKTCMFYMMKYTTEDFWRPDNLLACVQSCLKLLYQWACDGIFPMFFFPEQMKYISSGKRSAEKLIKADCKYLVAIRRNEFGKQLIASVQDNSVSRNPKYDFGQAVVELFIIRIKLIIARKNQILNIYSRRNPASSARQHLDIISHLRNVSAVNEHTEEETKDVVLLILPYIELSLLSNIVIHFARDPKYKKTVSLCLFSNKWHEVGVGSDSFSSRLTHATFLHMLGFYEESMAILSPLDSMCSFPKLSVCPCWKEAEETGSCPCTQETRMPRIFKDFLENYVAPCVAFPPSEKKLIPVALSYEMFRSFGVPTEYMYDALFWFDWGVVDSKVLLCFLLYLNHCKVNMKANASVDIANMEMVLDTDLNLGHRETGLNLLGWCYKQEGQMHKAAACFGKSLALQQLNNAAGMQLAFVVSQLRTI